VVVPSVLLIVPLNKQMAVLDRDRKDYVWQVRVPSIQPIQLLGVRETVLCFNLGGGGSRF
jgi:hypothetical protein